MDDKKFIAIVGEKILEKKAGLFLYLLIRIAVFCIGALSPLCFGLFVDALVTGGRSGLPARYALLFLGLSAANLALKYLSAVLNTRLDATLVFLLSQSAIKRYFAVSLDCLAKYESAYMSGRLIADTRSVVAFLLNSVVDTALGALQGMFMLVVIARLSLPVFGAAVAMLPVCGAIFYAFQGRIGSVAAATKDLAARYSAANQKQCAGYLFIKLNGLMSVSRSFVEGYFFRTLAGFLDYRKLSSAMDLLISLTQLAATGFLLFAGGNLVSGSAMSVGSFTAVFSYFATLVALTSGVVMAGRTGVETRESIARMDEVIGQARERSVAATPEGVNMPIGVASLSVMNLGIRFGQAEPLFGGFCGDFKPGKLYCVIGENGCGKSTLLKAISGGYRDYDGDVLVDGANIRSLDIEAFRRARVSYLPQSPTLFFETADEILSVGGAVADIDSALAMLGPLLGVPDPRGFIEERLMGNGSSVESRFSGGERQKIALACACARRADILLVDEPSSAMDELGRGLTAKLLKDYAAEAIVICVTHDEAIISLADSVIRI